jgi:prepilin-type N-terminal cleavage/methylation domain-containing protein
MAHFMPHPTGMRTRAAFTLVEIMIVVAIIALLVAIAVPSFLNARQSAQRARFINDLRIAVNAFEMYAAENGRYPADANRATVPAGMAVYLNKMNFTGNTPIGGQWDWDAGAFGFTAGVSAVSVTADVTQMQLIDEKIDDGDLNAGGFQTKNGRYSFIIE